MSVLFFFFFQAEDGIRDVAVTGVQTCALPIYGDLDRGVQPLETDHKPDRESEQCPFEGTQSQPDPNGGGRCGDHQLDPNVAFAPDDVARAFEREAERANERHTRSVRDTGILAVDSVARRINRES